MRIRTFHILIVFGLLLAACGPVTPIATEAKPTVAAPQETETPAPPVVASGEQPTKIVGGFKATNNVFAVYYEEHAVALIDMHGFVIRDEKWELPVASQVLGPMNVDEEALTATYELSLPLQPLGEPNDVDNNGKTDPGLQIYAVSYSPNLYGGPFSEGDDRSRGWPGYLASVKTDSENENEVIGGKLVIWSPDAAQQFPTGFGADKLLFTADDPVGPVPAGYSIVDLDTDPFTVLREAEPELTLYEPPDAALKDFAALPYGEAFDKMFDFVKTNYAFNGVAGKQPAWDELYAELKPQVEQAEKDKDVKTFYFAVRKLTTAFKDGHVGMGGGEGDQFYNEEFTKATEGGFGLAIRELDDGRVLAMFLTPGGPAEAAGMKLGAEITEFNGQPIKDAISAVVPWTLPQSSDFDIRYQQQRYLLRAPLDTEASLTFTNPGAASKTVSLKAVAERDSFRRTSRYFNVDTDHLLPVDSSIITQDGAQIGYVRINANYDDLYLLIRLFERALQQFQAREVAGIIIDMRYNSGGAPLGLAGFLTDKVIPTGQDEYYSEATGKFEPEGVPGEIIANTNQYKFDKLVLLVAPTCASACEYESYGFSQVPGMIVVGFEPTAGVFAEVSRGQIQLPEGIFMQIPTGRTVMPDGSMFLEGVGVVPTFRVPVDETTIYREDDVVLDFGIRAVLQPLGAGITPSAPPKLADAAGVEKALGSNTKQLEEKAREQYKPEELAQLDVTIPYTIALTKSENLFWAWGWCAKDQATLDENLKKIKLGFNLEGQDVPLDQFQQLAYDASGQKCVAYLAVLTDWQAGENHLTTTVTFTAPINDGSADYPAGKQVFEYTVYVKP